jgi:hypothetical protein
LRSFAGVELVRAAMPRSFSGFPVQKKKRQLPGRRFHPGIVHMRQLHGLLRLFLNQTGSIEERGELAAANIDTLRRKTARMRPSI